VRRGDVLTRVAPMDVRPEVLWLVAGLALVIIELMTGTFYLLIFGVAALLAAAAAWAGASFALQAAVAAILAVVGSFIVRQRRLALQGTGDVASMDVGQAVVFESWVDEPGRIARVRYRGAPWEAQVAAGASPAEGATLTITATRGNRLMVAPGVS
jgi:membrane protein implicated in regulation of membrane protease activity